MKKEASEVDDPEYIGAGYSVLFREDTLFSYSEIYNWWKMKSIISGMIREEGLKKGREYRFLDMGCSRGHDVFRLSREFGGYNVRLWGYDIVSQDIDFANMVARKKGMDNVNFKVANAENPGYPENFFDVITCSEVIEHQEKPEQVLRECHRALKPGGVMIITTPVVNNDFLFNRMKKRMETRVRAHGARMMGDNGAKKRREMPYEKHIFELKAGEWRDSLKAAGLEVEDLKRGSLVYGGPFFDRHVKLMGMLLLVDDVLDHITYKHSWNIVIKARKMTK